MDANNYKYDRLDSTKRSLRLLRLKGGTGQDLQCEIIHAVLGSEGLPYEAVSYTWGPNFKAASINIHGKILPISFNLNLILHDLRSPDTDRILWVDAICIDQRNKLERGHQVQQMKDIYGCAERVLFCICRPTGSTDLLMDSLRKLQEKLETRSHEEDSVEVSWKEVQLELSDNHLNSLSEQMEGLKCIQSQALKNILEQNWFRRVWILQEVFSARDALVYCGPKSISAAVFVIGTKLIRQWPDNSTTRHQETVQEVLNLMPGSPRSHHIAEYHRDLYSILRKFRHAEATEERDQIFALLGMCTDTQAMTFPKADYAKSMNDILCDTISHIFNLESGSVVATPYTTIRELFEDLDDLGETMLLYFILPPDVANALSIPLQGKEYIKICLRMLEEAAKNTMQIKGMMEFLLQQKGAETIFSHRFEDIPELLLWAAMNGYETVVKLLIEKGVDLEAQDEEHKTPLYYAAKNGHKGIIRLLVELGADIEAADNRKRTPLYCAAENGHEDIVRLLVELGADIKAADNRERTPLHFAAKNGHKDIVRLLVKFRRRYRGRRRTGRKHRYILQPKTDMRVL